MYPSFDRVCRDYILGFMHKHFPDRDSLVVPRSPLPTDADSPEIQNFFSGADYREDFRLLNNLVRTRGYNIPPLVNAYMALSPTMRVFGTAINDEFGDVEETGIFLSIEEILEEKKQRHILTFSPNA